MKIDAHHHFWTYQPLEYEWIDDQMQVIRRDFLPKHLQTELAGAGIDGVVSVQARQTLAETEWLLELASHHGFIRAVVGWVDLRSEAIAAQLERYATNPKLKSVRHVVQGEPDEQFILRADFNRGIRQLRRHSLAYDILVFERQLPQTISFVDTHPDQTFVLDHLAKPRIRDGQYSDWARNLRELARRPNVYAKVSGLVTEANRHAWTETQLRPYFDLALEVFGPRRLMFGSDWPVCLVDCSYNRWHQLVSVWVASLSADEQARVLGGTAVEAYKL
jgi:L-fuconolactonase